MTQGRIGREIKESQEKTESMRGKVKTKDEMESKGGAGEKRRNGMKKEKR